MPDGSARDRAIAIVSGADARARAHVLRCALSAIAPLYSVAVHAYQGLFRLGALRRVALPCPVVSIGNLTVGGTGKTGLAIHLASRLADMGLRPCVLAHGYRAASTKAQVVSDGNRVLLSPSVAGDEAVLLGKSLQGVPVLVGRRRAESGRMAIERFSPSVLILDDGFQYWRLERDLDVVLLDATNPLGFGHLLPRGLLREPADHLSRAQAVVITQCDRATPAQLDAALSVASRHAPCASLWRARYRPSGLRELNAGRSMELRQLRGARLGAMSSIAAPAAFQDALRALGAAEVVPFAFADHHIYTCRDYARVLSEASRRRLDAVVVTEKDAVKLAELPRPTEGPPMLVLSVRMELEGDADLCALVASVVASGGARR